MKITWDLEKRKLNAFCVSFDVNSDVRNELNGRRLLGDPKQVVRAIVNGLYSDPYAASIPKRVVEHNRDRNL